MLAIHLPQVIAAADYHSYIEKISDEHSTVSTVRLFNREERIEEIAKMLAVEDHLTEAARHSAEQPSSVKRKKVWKQCQHTL